MKSESTRSDAPQQDIPIGRSASPPVSPTPFLARAKEDDLEIGPVAEPGMQAGEGLEGGEDDQVEVTGDMADNGAEDAPVEASQPSEHGASPTKLSIYQFGDYRSFLRERMLWLQSQDPSFSQRKLARIAGFANPGFFNEVIQGRRKLSPVATERMSRGLSLQTNEAEFLHMLVTYSEAKTPTQREAAYRSLEQRRSRHFFQRLNRGQSKYYLDFNYPLVRAAVEACDFRGDYKVLGDFLRPPMPAANVKLYVRDLCEWGLVQQDRDGRYQVTHSYLEPPEGMRDTLVRLHQAWLSQTLLQLNSMQTGERHLSSALLTVSEKTYHAILHHIDKTREEILRMVKEDAEVDRVVLFNIQILPRGGGKG